MNPYFLIPAFARNTFATGFIIAIGPYTYKTNAIT
jgi:hypothetical protein